VVETELLLLLDSISESTDEVVVRDFDRKTWLALSPWRTQLSSRIGTEGKLGGGTE